jgi:hypothetical protein
MTKRAIGVGLLATAVLAAAGCGGGGGDGDGDAASGSGACTQAKADLNLSVSTRDRLFVDQRIKDATAACAGEYDEPGDVERCTAARADLEVAAAEETPPPDLDERIESAVAACVDTTITATIPPP